MASSQSATPAEVKDTALRRCIATGEVKPKSQLIRFVAAPGGEIVPDLAGRLPGRGLWVTPRRDILCRARNKNFFAKAARASVRWPDDMPDRLDRLLTERCLKLLGLARGAGLVAVGFEKAKSRVAAGKAAVLLQALDASPEGRRKLLALAGAVNPPVPAISLFTAQELGEALGRGPTVSVAVGPGGITERLREDLAKLMAMRVEHSGD